jgi:hypothetical protein
MTVRFAGTDSDEDIVPDYWHVPGYGRCVVLQLCPELIRHNASIDNGVNRCLKSGLLNKYSASRRVRISGTSVGVRRICRQVIHALVFGFLRSPE